MSQVCNTMSINKIIYNKVLFELQCWFGYYAESNASLIG